MTDRTDRAVGPGFRGVHRLALETRRSNLGELGSGCHLSTRTEGREQKYCSVKSVQTSVTIESGATPAEK